MSYTFSEDGKTCTASRSCGNDSAHDQSETVNCAAQITTPAGCETAGVTTYTATFANSAFETQTTTKTDVAALGHNWGTPTYTWNDDKTQVTATLYRGGKQVEALLALRRDHGRCCDPGAGA